MNESMWQPLGLGDAFVTGTVEVADAVERWNLNGEKRRLSSGVDSNHGWLGQTNNYSLMMADGLSQVKQ